MEVSAPSLCHARSISRISGCGPDESTDSAAKDLGKPIVIKACLAGSQTEEPGDVTLNIAGEWRHEETLGYALETQASPA